MSSLVVNDITNSSGTRPYSITLGTENTTTGGTAIDFIDIPSGVKRIVVMWNAVSGNGSSMKLLQLGTGSSTFENTGYVSVGQQMTSGANYGTNSTAGFLLRDNDAAERISGHWFLALEDDTANTWTCSHSMITSVVAGQSYVGAGAKTLSEPLASLRFTTVNGTDTWTPNGGINIQFQ